MSRKIEQLADLSSEVYKISPDGNQSVKAYCDFKRFGGGWTLLLARTSKSGWTNANVKFRNQGEPSKITDYSIFGLADAIKNADNGQVNMILTSQSH